jgi:hypothetical protein
MPYMVIIRDDNVIRRRQAVLTHDQALDVIRHISRTQPAWVDPAAAAQWLAAQEALEPTLVPLSGGSVGPMPDGTCIDVIHLTRAKLFRQLPIIVQARYRSWPRMPARTMCESFNLNEPTGVVA